MSHHTTLTDIEWAWATEHGAPERASTEQLLGWLARGELPPHTLVWRPGWGEWLPAMQVAELAGAFPSVTPGSRRVARAALEGAATPPAVPVAHYPRLRLLAKDVLADSQVPPAAAEPPGLAPAQAGRRAFRDLDHVQQDLVTSQVPAAAMLEAALAMKRLGTPLAGGAARRGGRHFGTFGEASSQALTPPPRTLSPLALELGFPALLEPNAPENSRRPSKGYGRWLLIGALVGGALGLLSVRGPSPLAAAPASVVALTPAPPPAPEQTPPSSPAVSSPAVSPPAVSPPAVSPPLDNAPAAPLVAPAIERVAPVSAEQRPNIVERKRKGEPAVLQALRVSKNDGFDRVVFEFRERMPGYRLQYLDKPVRDCGAGSLKRIEGNGRLEVRFSPASAHDEGGEPTVRERELKPALSTIREVERTCDFEGVVTWVVGTASAQHFRAFELATPPRLVVDIDH